MADAAPAPDPAAPAPDPALTPPGSIVGDAGTAPAAPAPAPALAVAAIEPAAARTYLTEHGMSAEDVAKIPEADLAKKYEETKAVEAAKPIEYKDFKLPEGVSLDAKLLADTKADFAAAKLTQDQAQTFIDKHVAAVKAAVDGNIAAFNKMQTDWQTEIKSDPQIGGANFESKTVPAIAKAIAQFCPDAASQKAFREAVSLTGIGNNPHYVRFMARLGASLMEGEPAGGKPPSGKAAQRDFDALASNLYPNQGQSPS